MNTITKQRDSSIDIARGIAIILVVTGHSVEKLADLTLATLLKGLVYIGHMPLFFVISGYLFKSGKSFKEIVSKLIKSILIPYFCCAAIIFIYTALSTGMTAWIEETFYDTSVLTTMLLGFITQKRYATIWFLPTLMFCELFFWIIDTYVKNDKLKYVVCALLGVLGILYDSSFAGYGNYSIWFPNAILANPLPWNLDAAFISLIFFGFGHFLKTKNILPRVFDAKKKRWSCGFFFMICAFAIYFFNYFNGYQTIAMWGGYYGIFPLTISAALLMDLGILLLSKLLTKAKLLAFIGQNTFVIMAFHQMIGLDLAFKIINHYSINVPTASGAICTLLIMYTGIILCSLFFGYGLHYLHLDFVVGKKAK